MKKTKKIIALLTVLVFSVEMLFPVSVLAEESSYNKEAPSYEREESIQESFEPASAEEDQEDADLHLSNVALNQDSVMKTQAVRYSGKDRYGNQTWELDENGTLTVKANGDLFISKLINDIDYSTSEDLTAQLSDQVKTVILDGFSEEQPATSIRCYILFPNQTKLILGKNVKGSYYASNENTASSSAPIEMEVYGDVTSFEWLAEKRLQSIRFFGSVQSMSIRSCSNLEEVDVAHWTGNLFPSMMCQRCEKLQYFIVEEADEPLIPVNTCAFMDCSSLEMFSSPSGLSTIGDEAFRNCEKLVSLPSLSQVSHIGQSAFENCSSLTEIDIQGEVDSIGQAAFHSCASLKSVYIHNLLSGELKSTFGGCTLLESVHIGSSKETISLNGGNFYSCSSLKKLELPPVDSIGAREFYECKSLEALPDFSLLTSIPEDTDFTSIYHDSNPQSPFLGMSSLKQVVFPDGVRLRLNNMFENCSSLTYVRLPSNIGNLIPPSCFKGCSALTKVENLDTQPELVTIYEAAFQGCTSLKSFVLPETVTTLKSVPDGLESFRIPEGTTLLDWALFRHCSHLEKITIPSTFQKFADVGSMVNSIDFLPNLSSIIIEERSTMPTLLLSKFPEDQRIELSLPASLESISLGGVKCIEELILPDSITTLKDEAFRGTSNLKTIKLSEQLTSIGRYAFHNCTSLESIELPDSLKTIDMYAFKGCTALKKVTLPKALETLEYCFEDCEGPIEELTIPNTINSWTLKEAPVRSVILEDGITEIPYSALSGTSLLEEVRLPQSLEVLNDYAFSKSSVPTLDFTQDTLTVGRQAIDFQDDNSHEIRFRCGNLILHDWAIYDTKGIMDMVLDCSNVTMESSGISLSGGSSLYLAGGSIDFGEGGLEARQLSNSSGDTVSLRISPEVREITGTVTVSGSGKLRIYGAAGSAAEELATRSIEALPSNKKDKMEFIPVENGVVNNWESTAQGFSFVVENGEAYITRYNRNQAVVTIPEFLDEFPVVGIRPGAFTRKDMTTKLILPKTIREFGWDFAKDVHPALQIDGQRDTRELTELDEIEIDTQNPYFCSAHGMVYNKDKTILYFALPGVSEATIPNSVTTISPSAFRMSQVRALTVPDSVTTIGEYAFSGRVRTLKLGKGITEIPGKICTNGYLETVEWDEGVTVIGDDTFQDCHFLKEAGPMERIRVIGKNAFRDCLSIQNLSFAPGLQEIGNHAFDGCDDLEKVDLPDSVTAIGDEAFASSGIKVFTAASKEMTIGNEIFKSTRAHVYSLSDSDMYWYSTDPDCNEDLYRRENAATGFKIGHYLKGIDVENRIKSKYLPKYINNDWFKLHLTDGIDLESGTVSLCASNGEHVAERSLANRIGFNEFTFGNGEGVVPGSDYLYIDFEGFVTTEDGKQYVHWTSKDTWLRETMPDVWGVVNPDDIIPLSMLAEQFGLLVGGIARVLKEGSRGICFGMSTSWLLTSTGAVDISTFGTKDMWSIEKGSYSSLLHMTALEYWQLMHISQFLPDSVIQKEKNRGKYEGLVDAVRNMFQGNGDPVVIDLDLSIGKHTLAPVAFEENTGSNYVTIYCYDSNYAGEGPKELQIIENSVWQYEVNSERGNGGSMTYVYTSGAIKDLLNHVKYFDSNPLWKMLEVSSKVMNMHFAVTAAERMCLRVTNSADNPTDEEQSADEEPNCYWYDGNNGPLALDHVQKGGVITMYGTRGYTQIKTKSLCDLSLFAPDPSTPAAVMLSPRLEKDYDICLGFSNEEGTEIEREIHITGEIDETLELTETEEGVDISGADSILISTGEDGQNEASWSGIAESALQDQTIHFEIKDSGDGEFEIEAKADLDGDGKDDMIPYGQQEPKNEDKPPANPTHTHSFGAWKVTKGATALAEGTETRTCSCGQKETRSIAKLTPTMKLNVSGTIPMQFKQSFKGIQVTGLVKGDSIRSVTSAKKKILKATLKNGKITLKAQKKAGTAKVTVKLASGLMKSFKVKVSKAKVKTKKISVEKKKLTLKAGKKASIVVKLTPITSQEKVTFKSSKKAVASVSKKGIITAKKKGKAVITIKSGKKSCKVTVIVK